MAHQSLISLFGEIEQAAAMAYANGIRFFVAVESQAGEWFALHADDQGHAGILARAWVDDMGARGASCWRLYPDGPALAPFAVLFEQPNWEEVA